MEIEDHDINQELMTRLNLERPTNCKRRERVRQVLHTSPSEGPAISGPEAGLNLPRRINDPASAARVAKDLLRSRREDGPSSSTWTTATASSGMRSSRWAGSKPLGLRPTRCSSEPRRVGRRAPSSSATAATGRAAPRKPSRRPFRAIAAACGRHGLAVVDHLVVVASGGYHSTFAGR